MTNKEVGITTFDNPFDVFDDFEHWNNFDTTRGYNTNELLARFVVVVSNELFDEDFENLTEIEQEIVNEKSIDRILAIDFENIYKKVIKETE